MSRADSNIDSKFRKSSELTRRAAVLSLAAVAAPSAALCLPGPRGADPALTAVERYRAGYAFHERCCDRINDIEERVFAKLREFDATLEERASEFVPKVLAVLKRGTGPAPTATWDQAHALLRALGREQIEKENSGELEEAERLCKEGSDAEMDALGAMLRTAPTTAAGAAAMLRVILEGIERGDSITDALQEEFQIVALLESLETFLRRSA